MDQTAHSHGMQPGAVPLGKRRNRTSPRGLCFVLVETRPCVGSCPTWSTLHTSFPGAALLAAPLFTLVPGRRFSPALRPLPG